MSKRCRLASSKLFLLAALMVCAGVRPAVGQRASLSNDSRSFGSVGLGTTSAPRSVTLSNSSSVALSVSSIVVSGDFAQTNTCGSSVPARGSCTISITFKPTAAGSRTGTVTITDNANNSPQRITLSGTGVAPASMTPASRSYASTNVGATTASKAFTLTNNLSSVLPVSSIATTGDFIQTNNCGTQLAANRSCTINVSFRPTANGTRTGTVVATIGSGIALSGTMSGTGTGAPAAAITVSPASLTFASQTVGTTSGPQTITVTNTGSASAAVSVVTASGDFGRASTCSSSLAVGSSCSITVAFTPTATGPRTGSVTFTAAGIARTIGLTGQGVAPTLPFTYSPTALDFGVVSNGTVVTKTVTLTNSGTTPLTLQILPLTSPGTQDYVVTNKCGGQVPTASSCTLDISFEGHTVGNWVTSYNGELANFSIDGTTHSVTLSATSYVVPPAISPTSMNFGSVQVGSLSDPNSFSVAINQVGPVVASISASGDFTQVNTCSSGTYPCTVTVTFRPTATGNRTGAITVNYPSPVPPQVVSLTGTGLPGNGACAAPQIDLKLLVVSNGKTEADFGAIKQILDYVGTPYTVVDFKATPAGVTAGMLSDGSCHGFYQGVIFANGNYVNTLPGMAALTAYEQKFNVRQLNWFASPAAAFGLNPTNRTISANSTYTGIFAPGASSVFFYANTATPITFSNATVYLASPMAGAVTPLITDSTGNVLSLIYDLGDGRQYLTQTFDSNQYLMHDLVLAYGLLNWVTKGVFLGDYHVYASAQVDDVFINDSEWIAGTRCGTDSGDESLPTFRLNAADVDAFINWLDLKQSNPLLPNFTVSLAFNGVGTTGDRDYTGLPSNAVDDLTPKLKATQARFNWISHTWDHPDSLNGMNQAQIDGQLIPNNSEAATLGLTNWNPVNLVTPGVSGLNDTRVPGYMVNDGIRYVVTDTSVTNQVNNGPNPSPNVGIVNSFANQLYEVPRHANDLYYNVSNPVDWQAEYRCIYAGQSPYSSYTASQIRDYISASFVVNMLKGDMDPEMFHQPNMHAYDGTHSLLGDLYDATFTTYFKLLNLPILSPTLDVLGKNMQNRDAYNRSGVTASIVNGPTPQIVISIPAGSPVASATIPVTGLNSAGAEVYGGQNIAHLPLNKGQMVTLPLQ
jgi:hypothetical protein